MKIEINSAIKTRPHHNNKGHQQIKSGGTYKKIKHMAKRLGIKVTRKKTDWEIENEIKI